jgi:hypothetical protein
MLSIKEKIIQKLDSFSELELAQLLELTENINKKESIEDPLLNVIGILSGEPISTDKIDQELYDLGENQ